MSFVMLTESQVVPPEGSPTAPPPRKKEPANDQDQPEDNPLLSEKLERATRLFEIISAHSDIDAPICTECTDLLLDSLQKRVSSSTKERDMYVEMLRRFNADIPSDEELQTARKDLDAARAREKAAMTELEKLEAEKAAMDQELLSLKTQSASLSEKEDAYCASRIAFTQELSSLQKERSALLRKYENDSRSLQRLQRANVYNDTFQISHDGLFGTINGLRLGRLPDKPVDWAEINAAWGHTLHLLSVVSQKLGHTFPNHKLLPLGSKSKIIAYVPRSDKQSGGTGAASTSGAVTDFPSAAQKDKGVEKIYELYSSGDFSTLAPLSGLLHRKFDASLTIFLSLLNSLIQHVLNTPMHSIEGKALPPPNIPYSIERDKIGDVSIRLGGGGMMGGGNNEESWTKACKNVLTDCKYLLAQASFVGDTPMSATTQRVQR